MIVVDTSVWIDVNRRPASPRGVAFRSLLDADEVALALPVRVELMSGVSRKDRKAFRRALSALPLLKPTDDTWQLVETWVEPAADAGLRFSVTDLVIAALAKEIGGLVWSIDSDFQALESLGFAQLYA